MHRFCLSLAWFVLCLSPCSADLVEYIKKNEPKYAWKLKEKKDLPQGTTYELELISQEWQEIVWEHALVVYQPKNSKPAATMLLWNQGGTPSAGTASMAFEIANRLKAPVAFLYGVPKQPLFNGMREDVLIAETFVRYLNTKDARWPLLFPMVKSVIKAMDALQDFGQNEWKFKIEKFVVTGASKRGWTSWLTAASGDTRVKAIMPLVIDTLHFKEQMPHQIKSFGKPSDQVADYTRRSLIPIPDTAEAKNLWMMVDPWAYREKLTLPKMIVNGTNDPYWSQDALNLYWDDLQGDKWILYVPNAGHNLQQTFEDGRKDNNRALAILAAFARHQMTDKPMPKLNWKHGEANGKYQLEVKCEPAPKKARLWVADADTRDFRKSRWKDEPATIDNGLVKGSISKPENGWRTFFAELDYEIDGIPYNLSTQLRMVQK